MLTVKDLCELLKISRTTLRDIRMDAGFPKPKKVGKSLRWSQSDIDAWLANQ